jgi:hypothetical protein
MSYLAEYVEAQTFKQVGKKAPTPRKSQTQDIKFLFIHDRKRSSKTINLAK